MTIISYFKNKTLKERISEFEQQFEPYCNIIMGSTINFSFSAINDVLTISFHLFPNQIVFTVVLKENTTEISKYDLQSTYNIDLIFLHLQNFSRLNASINLDDKPNHINYGPQAIFLQYDTVLSFQDFLIMEKGYAKTVYEKYISFENEQESPAGNTIDIEINYGDNANIHRLRDYKFDASLKEILTSEDGKAVRLVFMDKFQKQYVSLSNFVLDADFENPAHFAQEGKL